MGREPQQHTTYTYRDGVLVQSITRRDPEWDPLSYALAALYRDWKATLCPGCGEPYSSHEGKTFRDYTAVAHTCPAVIATDIAAGVQAKHDEKTLTGLPEHVNPGRSHFWTPVLRTALKALTKT